MRLLLLTFAFSLTLVQAAIADDDAEYISECAEQAELCQIFGGDPNLCYGLYFELCVNSSYLSCFKEYNECLRSTLGSTNKCAHLAPSIRNLHCVADRL